MRKAIMLLFALALTASACVETKLTATLVPSPAPASMAVTTPQGQAKLMSGKTLALADLIYQDPAAVDNSDLETTPIEELHTTGRPVDILLFFAPWCLCGKEFGSGYAALCLSVGSLPVRGTGSACRMNSHNRGGSMVIDPNLTSLEIMGIAIKSEIEAAQVYDRLAQRVRNLALKDKLLFLKAEEEKHRSLLEEMYASSFSEVKLVLPPRSLLPKVDIALSEKTPVPELLEIAMEWEKLSEEFYADFARRAEDTRGRAVLQYLSKMESSHYYILKTEHDLISQFPDYYNVEEFHFGEEMVHLGP